MGYCPDLRGASLRSAEPRLIIYAHATHEDVGHAPLHTPKLMKTLSRNCAPGAQLGPRGLARAQAAARVGAHVQQPRVAEEGVPAPADAAVQHHDAVPGPDAVPGARRRRWPHHLVGRG